MGVLNKLTTHFAGSVCYIPPRTAVVLCSSDVFAWAKTRVQKLTRRSIFELGTDAAGSMQQRRFVNLQRPCCKLTCEFSKSIAFGKRRFWLTRPASIPEMPQTRRWKMYTDVHFSSGTVHTVCVSSRGDKPHESQDCRCCCRGCCCSVYRRRSSSRYCSSYRRVWRG